MKRIVFFFILISFFLVFSLPKTKCWLYELRNKQLVLIKVSVSNMLPSNNYQGVLILDYDATPTETQIEFLKESILKRLGLKDESQTETQPELNDETQPET